VGEDRWYLRPAKTVSKEGITPSYRKSSQSCGTPTPDSRALLDLQESELLSTQATVSEMSIESSRR
jgi:hypothetical protein